MSPSRIDKNTYSSTNLYQSLIMLKNILISTIYHLMLIIIHLLNYILTQSMNNFILMNYTA